MFIGYYPGVFSNSLFFGREIARTQQVPVGLICAHWGGTNIEPWISAQALGEVPDFVEQLKLIRRLGNKDCDLQAEEEQRQAKILSLDKGMRNGKPFGILFLIMMKDGYLILSPEISKRLFLILMVLFGGERRWIFQNNGRENVEFTHGVCG